MKIYLYSEQRFIAFHCAEIIRTALTQLFILILLSLLAGILLLYTMLSQGYGNVKSCAFQSMEAPAAVFRIGLSMRWNRIILIWFWRDEAVFDKSG